MAQQAVGYLEVYGCVAALVAAEATIDKACTKGVLHKNNASRKVSRLASTVNKI